MMLFDTHAHLNAEQFDTDLEEVIARAKAEKLNESSLSDSTSPLSRVRWS